MSTSDLPDSFDPRQPDLPTLAVDPDPLPAGHDGQDTDLEPLTDDSHDPTPDAEDGTR